MNEHNDTCYCYVYYLGSLSLEMQIVSFWDNFLDIDEYY